MNDLEIAEIIYDSGEVQYRYARYLSTDGTRWIRHGLFVSYHPNGDIASQGVYVDGFEHGEWRDYYPGGQIAAEGIYSQGEEVPGTWRFWAPDGMKGASETILHSTSSTATSGETGGSPAQMISMGIEMTEYGEFAMAAESAGNEIFWLGCASGEQVERLEALLGAPLSASYKRFLESYGGGGIVSAEISGIENDDAAMMTGGTVLGDTTVCRDRYGLPGHLVVIYFHDDEVCWCLDTSQGNDGEFPVVSYNLFTRKVDKAIAKDFPTFMRQHLALYLY